MVLPPMWEAAVSPEEELVPSVPLAADMDAVEHVNEATRLLDLGTGHMHPEDGFEAVKRAQAHAAIACAALLEEIRDLLVTPRRRRGDRP